MVIGAKIGQAPAEDTFDADNNIFDEGKDQFEKQFRVGFFDILMDNDFSHGSRCRHTFFWHADRHRSNTYAADCKITSHGVASFWVKRLMKVQIHYILHLKEGQHQYHRALLGLVLLRCRYAPAGKLSVKRNDENEPPSIRLLLVSAF